MIIKAKIMHHCVRTGRLHKAVHTGCLHTNQHWCLLSALILVNTDIYMKKWSDRCMIEVLKCRHCQQLSSSPPTSQGCCDSPHASLSRHYTVSISSFLPFFLVPFTWCNAPFASYSVNCLMVSAVWNNHLLSFTEVDFFCSLLKRSVAS